MNLIANDGVNFQIELENAHKFKVISDLMDDVSAMGPIPISNVNSEILGRLLKFAREGVVDCPDPWLIKDPDYAILFEMARAADFLNYQECLDHVCQIIATSLQGKPPHEIRRILG